MNAESETSKAMAINLKDYVEYAKDSIVSKTLIEKKGGTITLFAFDQGQGLSEHTAPFDAVVQILEGEAKITIGENLVRALPGQMVIMLANIPHSVKAVRRFKMLLTMIRA
ncbi:MAG: cupin domain-containing protein [Deltaproteobacteria bacterium]|nr:MAG: cupin domain-containing protein [Deltaproteobacteria bacterium]